LHQDGAACCIIASEDFVKKHGLQNQAIEIVAQALTTDNVVTFEGRSAMDVVGFTMSKICADQVFKDAGFAEGRGRDEVGVVELHDCFAANEVGCTVVPNRGLSECFMSVNYLSGFGTLQD
jgi:sterol carrier protein 2